MSALRRILEHKRDEVAEAKLRVPLAELKQVAQDQPPPRAFRFALESAKDVALIAEIKPASPSAGPIRPNLEPARVAAEYEEAGAHALSVLTDRRFFQGCPENVQKAKGATGLPVLRKDFLEDPYQIVESRAMGADAILLIVAALEPNQLVDLREYAKELGMPAVVEVHDESEADIALETGCDLIGVNNRNLATFETSLEVSERLLPRIAPHAFAVSESAIETHDDVLRVQRAGARAVLIGTAFCAADTIGRKVREVMGWR